MLFAMKIHLLRSRYSGLLHIIAEGHRLGSIGRPGATRNGHWGVARSEGARIGFEEQLFTTRRQALDCVLERHGLAGSQVEEGQAP